MAEQIELRAAGSGDPSPRRWVASDDYLMLSMAFTLRSTEPQFAEALRWHLAPFRLARPRTNGIPVDLIQEDEDDRPTYSFRFATRDAFRSRLLTEVVGRAIWQIHAAVPEKVRDFLLLHSGAVARNGEAILLPAPMDSGKSSLVLGLLQAGFGYLSDELGAIDPVTGRAYAFPKRIKVDPTALEFFPGLEGRLQDRESVPFRLWSRFVRPEDLGAAGAGPARIRMLVFLTSDWEGRPRLTEISPADAVSRLAASCFNLFRYGERGVVLLSRVAEGARSFELRGGTPLERAALIGDRLA